MRIAILGTRGIPANYGGFETFAEELSARLAERGHAVTVYCRERHPSAEYRGVRLVHAPAIRHKYLDTLSHTAFSTLHLLRHRADCSLYCNAANACFTWMPRLFGIPVALNVDGLERKRRKWNALARGWYAVSERLSTIFPTVAVSDAKEIQRYYKERYGASTVFIPYGADPALEPSGATLKRLGLEPRRYFLYVSRFEPENNALLVREAFERIATGHKLALIGDAPYASAYIRQVRATHDPRIVIPGAIYGGGYRELSSHSFAYIHATEVGGTHPALIESMARGALVLYLDTPENREVAGGAGIAFHHDTLPAEMERVLAMPEEEREQLRIAARDRARERYSWDAVTGLYEELFQRLTRRK